MKLFELEVPEIEQGCCRSSRGARPRRAAKIAV